MSSALMGEDFVKQRHLPLCDSMDCTENCSEWNLEQSKNSLFQGDKTSPKLHTEVQVWGELLHFFYGTNIIFLEMYLVIWWLLVDQESP